MSWIRGLLRRRQLNEELAEEIREHLREKIEELVEAGAGREEAEHAARREFGNVRLMEEDGRGVWQRSFVRNWWTDMRYGARQLRKNPGFAAVAILSLALGIMATTAMYSVIYGVVLDPFPYKDVDSLMSVKVWSPDQRGFRLGYTVDQFVEIAERNTIFSGTIASTISDVVWDSKGKPERLRGNVGTMNTFDVMGVPPLLGRTPTSADAEPSAAPVAVLGYKFWQRAFGGDPGVLGREMLLNGKMRTVIGVMPRRFMWRGADVYLPAVFRRGKSPEGVRYVHLLGRLKPGVTEAQAQTDLRPIIADLKQREPAAFPDKWKVGLLSFKETFPSGIQGLLWMLFGAVGLLMLIACANVSNLLLAHGASRQREIALRASLGATRGRIVRQLLTESLLLSAVAGVLGVVMAYAALHAIIAMVPPDSIPDEAKIAIDRPVLFFTLGISLLTTLLFGLAPALHASGTHLDTVLRESARGAGTGLRQVIARNGMVIAEVALSLVLLVAATLMMRTLVAIQDVNLGIRTDHVLTLRVPLLDQRYADAKRRAQFFRELLDRVERLPGVEAASVSSGMHPFYSAAQTAVQVDGSAQTDSRPVSIDEVSREYMKVFGIGLVEGREFSENELADREQLAMVNQSFVRTYLATGDPVGRIVRVPRLQSAPFNLADDGFQIIGVVKDAVNRGLTNEIAPEMYIPYTITGMASNVEAMTATDPDSLAKSVTAEVYAIDAEQPVTEVRTLSSLLNDWEYAGPRFSLVLFATFAALGLLLAVIGVYGLVSQVVSQQTREIGVRMALGAQSGNILGLVLSRGARLTLSGVGIGIVAGVLAARLMSRLLFGVGPLDPVTFVGTAALMTGVALAACYIPARRAMKVDPMVALRYE